MNFLISPGRRALLQFLLVLPFVRLLRLAPGQTVEGDGDDIVLHQGWVLKRKDLV